MFSGCVWCMCPGGCTYVVDCGGWFRGVPTCIYMLAQLVGVLSVHVRLVGQVGVPKGEC